MRIGSRRIQTEPSKALTPTRRPLLPSQARWLPGARGTTAHGKHSLWKPQHSLGLVQLLTPDTKARPPIPTPGSSDIAVASHGVTQVLEASKEGHSNTHQLLARPRAQQKELRIFMENRHTVMLDKLKRLRERELCMLQHNQLQHIPLESHLCSGQVTRQSGPCSFCYLPLKHPVTNTGRNKTLDHRGCRPHLTWQSFCSR